MRFSGNRVTVNPIYDLGANTGWVSVGTDHETAAFAVNTLRAWWTTRGRHAYPDTDRLLITADSGGAIDGLILATMIT